MIRILTFFYWLLLLTSMLSCGQGNVVVETQSKAFRITRNITYNGKSVDVVIDKPEGKRMDVLVVYHGTTALDIKILEAANTTLDAFKKILDRKDMMIVSVAYPEQGLLMGDNVAHSEAGLLWVKNQLENDLGITINKTFLGGHSQGAYIVTRLNILHQTNGVIANAPGPLNLVYRCGLEESGKIESGTVCNLLRNTYGSTNANSDAYYQRSLLNFTSGFKSDILFVQGMQDTFIQMYSWPRFRQQIERCTNCQKTEFLELPNFEHEALFYSQQAKEVFNNFINSR